MPPKLLYHFRFQVQKFCGLSNCWMPIKTWLQLEASAAMASIPIRAACAVWLIFLRPYQCILNLTSEISNTSDLNFFVSSHLNSHKKESSYNSLI